MYIPYTQITPPIQLRRNRALPVAGTVMVRLGQKVTTDDVIAEAVIPTHHELVDVVRLLGLSDAAESEELIDRKAGETLGEHDIIAETGGLFSRIVRTPAPGKIISIHQGQVLIETETRKLTLLAYYPGLIAEILPNRGAVIETAGSVIQGVWGNGKFAEGTLFCQMETPDSGLNSGSFEINARGTILACANCTEAKFLDTAASLPVSGLILGSMPYSLVQKALAQPYPILLTEGFGKCGMNHAAFKYLTMYNSHGIVLNAEFESGSSVKKPEGLISASVESASTGQQDRGTSGQLVRIHTAPFMGQVATVERFLPGLTALPNGLRVSAASVIMENKERKTIPVDNLDSVGFTQSNLS